MAHSHICARSLALSSSLSHDLEQFKSHNVPSNIYAKVPTSDIFSFVLSPPQFFFLFRSLSCSRSLSHCVSLVFFLSLFYFSISPAHIKTIHIHIITYSTPPLHANPLETIKSFFNRNINTSAIWLPQEKQMRWKQAIKIETLYKERKKYTTRDPVLERHGVRGNTLTQRHEKWRSVSTRKDKVFCLCFYWEMNEKKKVTCF